jgi:hypothetical protein
MRAYSLDLRQKVVAAYNRGHNTIEEIAAIFSVGPTFVKKPFSSFGFIVTYSYSARDCSPSGNCQVGR